MERKTKNILFIIFTIIGCFVVGVTKTNASEIINYNNIRINNKEYATLLNLGFSDEQIYYMNEETFDANKNLDAKLLSQTTRYYKTVSPAYGTSYTVEVTKDEYDNSKKDITNTRGLVDTTYKRIVSSISANGNKYRYSVTTTWKSMPSVHSYDIIGIGFSNYVYINSSVYFSFTYANASNQYITSTTYYNKKSTSSGGAAVYKIPSGTIKSLSANLYYDVSKLYSGTITTLTICGDYAHATSNVSTSNLSDYGIGIGGISLGTSLSPYYDATPCATENAYVNW